MAEERASFTGRLRRMASVGTQIGSVGARYAANRLNGGLNSKEQARDLVRALGGLKGPLMKTAQIAATIPDLLPPEYAQELAQLQADAPPMGWPFVKRRMRAELGEDWQARFAQFEQQPASAASLGQVHRARLPDGRLVACKLQYPDMASAVEGDLSQLKLLFRAFGLYENAVDTRDIYEELTARLREELDYTHEAKNLSAFAHALSQVEGVHVPAFLPELSTQRLLTMEWLEGQRFSAYLENPGSQAERNAIAERLFLAWYTPFYRYGFIHGDPHLGNYALRADKGLNLFDFGAVRRFEPEFVRGVIELYHALRTNDTERARAAYQDWGFPKLSGELVETLNLWARFLYAPMMEDRVVPMGMGSDFTVEGAKVAQQVREKLRETGGIRVPRAFVLMDRAAIGLGSAFMRLGAELNWHRLFHQLVDDFSVEALAKRQQEVLRVSGLPRIGSD